MVIVLFFFNERFNKLFITVGVLGKAQLRNS